MSSQADFPWLKDYPEGVNWHMDIPERPIFAMLDDAVEKYPERPAFDFLDKKWTWAELGELANRFAKGLQMQGIGKGDKVGLFLPNTPYYLIAYYGVLKAGGTVVNFNPLYAEHELVHQIEDSQTELMVTLDLAMMIDKMNKMFAGTCLKRMVVCPFVDILPFPKNKLFPLLKRKDLAKIPEKSDRVIWFDDITDNDGAPEAVSINPIEDVAVLQYTGGTTGVPKGAMLTHHNIYANALQAVAWLGDIEPGTKKMMGVLPFFHVFAMTVIMNLSVILGMEIIAMPRFDLKKALKIIDKKKPDFFPAVPAIYSAINNYKQISKYDLSSLQYCVSGGAPLPVEVKKNFEATTGCAIVEGYGLSESSPVASINPMSGKRIDGSIGKPVPGTIIEIINADDKVTVMPIGERGELCIRGPQVMKGYHGNDEATADTIRPTPDGGLRLHTGDVAIMDAEGWFMIVDRIKDMIITNGYNVYPRNVEEAIYMHPAIEECIVAGLPDKQRGEIIKAWIKLKDGRELNGQDLKEFLSDKISKMEIPKRIEFRDEPLPKTMIGKLSRKDIIAEELGDKS